MPAVDRQIVSDPEALASYARDEFTALAREAVAARGVFTVALSGGSTPKHLYQLLAESSAASAHTAIDWANVHLFFGDERTVPPDHADSNYRMAREAMIDRVPVPAANVHRIRGEETSAHEAARHYARDLTSFFYGTKALSNGLPRFDLVLLGMGPDGHYASLFPGTSAVLERQAWVLAPFVDKFRTHRVTLSAPVLSNALRILFLVGGADKAETVKAVLAGPYRPDVLPSQLIKPLHGRLTWALDRAAAAGL